MDKPSSPSPNVVQAAEFESRLLGQIPFSPTESQERFAHVWLRFVVSDKPRCALILRGYAGTGKPRQLVLWFAHCAMRDKSVCCWRLRGGRQGFTDMQGMTLQPSIDTSIAQSEIQRAAWRTASCQTFRQHPVHCGRSLYDWRQWWTSLRRVSVPKLAGRLD